MNSMIRLGVLVNKVIAANPHRCLENICDALTQLTPQAPDLVVLPALSLCSPSCGELFRSAALLTSCQTQLEHLCVTTSESEALYLVGLAVQDGIGAVPAIAALHRGQVVAMVQALDAPRGLRTAYSQNILPPDTLLRCGGLTVQILSCEPRQLPLYSELVLRTGADLVVVPAFAPVVAGAVEQARGAAREFSRTLGCAVAVVNGGPGNTSHPYVYQGFSGVYECGRELAFACAEYDNLTLCCDLDTDILRARKVSQAQCRPCYEAPIAGAKKGLLRPLARNPWLPAESPEAYLRELHDLQVRALAARLDNAGISRMVLGISGGLDSTLALLTCIGAADALHLPRQNVIGVTMPGFGTSDRTYYNALSLLEALGVQSRDISIKASVLQHFEDIGHDASVRDTTYENAQARERTQVLLDLANAENGLVIGSGDLSEEALGFCTFGGDHLAGYNVNSSLTKTTIRALLTLLAREREDVGDILIDILDTPVSPELLPPDESGAIQQKTEELLGPYELHDFFLYYFVRYGFSPSKLFYYACIAFSGELEPGFIKEKLRLFLRRLFGSQFKRSCAPDGAILCEDTLAGAEFYIPSDCTPAELLRELDEIQDF